MRKSGDVLLVETLLHAANVLRADVVPAALVVAERPVRGKCRGSGQTGILRENIGRSGSRENEDVENTALRDPVRGSGLGNGMGNVDPGVRSDRVENANGGVCGVCMHEGNGAVERHG